MSVLFGLMPTVTSVPATEIAIQAVKVSMTLTVLCLWVWWVIKAETLGMLSADSLLNFVWFWSEPGMVYQYESGKQSIPT